MTPDRARIARALAALDALVAEHPELRRPAARRRLADALAAFGATADTSEPRDAPEGRAEGEKK